MELRMQSHQWESRAPDWAAAAVSGFVGGAAVMLMELFWSTMVLDISPWAASHLIAAMVMGPDVLQSTAFSFSVVTVALIVHYLLGICFGLILATIIAPFRFDSSVGMVLLVGAVFGLALYLLNFYGMAGVFPWFIDMRNTPTLMSQILFGMTAALMYMKLER